MRRMLIELGACGGGGARRATAKKQQRKRKILIKTEQKKKKKEIHSRTAKWPAFEWARLFIWRGGNLNKLAQENGAGSIRRRWAGRRPPPRASRRHLSAGGVDFDDRSPRSSAVHLALVRCLQMRSLFGFARTPAARAKFGADFV